MIRGVNHPIRERSGVTRSPQHTDSTKSPNVSIHLANEDQTPTIPQPMGEMVVISIWKASRLIQAIDFRTRLKVRRSVESKEALWERIRAFRNLEARHQSVAVILHETPPTFWTFDVRHRKYLFTRQACLRGQFRLAMNEHFAEPSHPIEAVHFASCGLDCTGRESESNHVNAVGMRLYVQNFAAPILGARTDVHRVKLRSNAPQHEEPDQNQEHPLCEFYLCEKHHRQTIASPIFSKERFRKKRPRIRGPAMRFCGTRRG